MPRGANTKEHKKAQIKKYSSEASKAKNKISNLAAAEKTPYGKSLAILIDGVINTATGARKKAAQAKARLQNAKRLPAERNLLRRPGGPRDNRKK